MQLRQNVTFQVHESTHNVSTYPGREHLSVLETYVLRHPEQLKMVIRFLCCYHQFYVEVTITIKKSR